MIEEDIEGEAEIIEEETGVTVEIVTIAKDLKARIAKVEAEATIRRRDIIVKREEILLVAIDDHHI